MVTGAAALAAEAGASRAIEGDCLGSPNALPSGRYLDHDHAYDTDLAHVYTGQ
jgi:hypothetical protein